MMNVAAFLAVLVGSYVAAETRDKRILLHSGVDIAHAIMDLKNEVGQLKTEVSQLKTDNSQLKTDNSQLKLKVSQLESTGMSRKGSGSTYVRWGRTTCGANGTTLAYSGVMGGGQRAQSGAAVNHLCLTTTPLWDYYDESIASWGSVYGSEYEFFAFRSDGGARFFGNRMLDQDAPCAVCHSPRSATMMIPGRNQCYPGWTKEYSGYLVSGAKDQTAGTEYICMDRRPEAIPGGSGQYDGNVLYMVEAICGGSLLCPPYVDGRELTCVVCTQ